MVDAVREEDSSSQNVNIYITKIQTKEAFTEVSISTGASFFISDADFLAFPFRKGDEISSEVVESLERGHKLILCRSKALSLLDLAEHSAFMLRTKLRQRGFEPAVVEAVLAQLKEKNYLTNPKNVDLMGRGIYQAFVAFKNKQLGKTKASSTPAIQEETVKTEPAQVQEKSQESVSEPATNKRKSSRNAKTVRSK